MGPHIHANSPECWWCGVLWQVTLFSLTKYRFFIQTKHCIFFPRWKSDKAKVPVPKQSIDSGCSCWTFKVKDPIEFDIGCQQTFINWLKDSLANMSDTRNSTDHKSTFMTPSLLSNGYSLWETNAVSHAEGPMDVAPEGEMKGMDEGVVHPYGKGWEGFLEDVCL